MSARGRLVGVVLAAGASLGCTSTQGACVASYADRPRGDGTACRTDLDEAACLHESTDARFTRGAACPPLGYPCLTTALGGVLYDRRDPDGRCPSGTMALP